VTKRKLIEVALPLEAINREAERDTPKRANHPWRMHYWWARRKLATARAVLFSQLVDDPSAHPERFPTEEDQRVERDRLHRLIERLVDWESVREGSVLAEAQAEILRSTDGRPPAILDPFAGGGTIPLEAQRLGLEARASDLNPVAVLINKALIEIPPKFAGRSPVFPGAADSKLGSWPRATGLAEDIRRYGSWVRDRAEERLRHVYPGATLDDGTRASVIAWIWARTVACPNPACGIQMPLVRSWWLGKKRGKEAYVVPNVVTDALAPGGRRVEFTIGRGKAGPTSASDGTVGRQGAACVACQTPVSLEYVRAASRDRGLGVQLMAVIAEGNRQRTYLAPDAVHEDAANVPTPDDAPAGGLFDWPGRINVYRYGLTEFSQLFTPRQLTALTTFSDLVAEARKKVLADALAAGMPGGGRLASGGADGEAYADAIATYLGIAVSRGSDYQSNITTWHNQNEQIRNVFARQAIPMAWDFLEVNPLGSGSGTWASQVELSAQALDGVTPNAPATVLQDAAQKVDFRDALLSTDPPYYDNVSYADLSDFFYVWLRRSLRDVQPELFRTMLSPKGDELVANPYRLGGRSQAETFFEDGFRSVFEAARTTASEQYPIAVYYAFKQSDSTADGESSTGWETLLEGMIRSGWAITSTWPMRTETASRMLGQGTNALASSIVLSLRPRPALATTTDRRGFIAALEAELPDALRKLQQGAIAPVDLPQAAIGPGMAVFSRFSGVLEPDGSKMTVRSALARINEILDAVLSEQEGDYKPDTRFAITWYRLHGYQPGKSGEAENVATARAVVLSDLARSGILTHRGGIVQLILPSDLTGDYDPAADHHISVWEVLQHLIQVLERDGIAPAGDLLRAALDRPAADIDADEVKELAHLLFRIAEANGWTKDALSFNTLVTSWPEIIDVARQAPAPASSTQGAFSFEAED